MKPNFGELKEVLNEMPSGTKILTVKNGSASTFFEKMGTDRWMWLHPASDGKPSSFDKIVDPHTEVHVVWTPTVGVHSDPDMSATLRWDTGDMWVLVHPNGATAAEFSECEAKKFGYRIPTNSTDSDMLTVDQVVALPVGSIVADCDGDCWVKTGEQTWFALYVSHHQDGFDSDNDYFDYYTIETILLVDDHAPIKLLTQPHVARAYFAAHPEPKPWLGAQNGEVWSVSDGDEGGLAVCRREPDQDSGDDHPYFYGPNFDGVRGDALTAGTRLEV